MINHLVNNAITRFRSIRNRQLLQSPSSAQYAFVGVGNHALQNLYPVLQYLGIRLKYICCKTADKIPLIEQRFGVIATTSLDMILNDDEVKGIFVCTSAQSHKELCSRISKSNKYLFVEKPPCTSLSELENMIAADNDKSVMVGMQKRYSPYVTELRKRLANKEPLSYTLLYHTGAYPEGDAITDLFIHPIDTAIHLFGNAEITNYQTMEFSGNKTIQLLLSHKKAKGFIELSTAYSWTSPEESLYINTNSGEYRLEKMERLLYYPHPKKLIGIPLEKIGHFNARIEILAQRNNFNPLAVNNQLYSQGFVSEIMSFANMVEHNGENRSPLLSVLPSYRILNSLGK